MTKLAAATRSLVVEREMPHPPEKIWRALTQGPLIEEWLMKNDFQPVAGHRFNFRATPMPHWNGVTDCQVLVVEPYERLSYSWNASGEEAAKGLKTVVTELAMHRTSSASVRSRNAMSDKKNSSGLGKSMSIWTFLERLSGMNNCHRVATAKGAANVSCMCARLTSCDGVVQANRIREGELQCRDRIDSRKAELGSVTKTEASGAATNKTEKIEVENVNHPGRVKSVDRDLYEAMKQAYLKILPRTSPGLTLAKISERLIAHLPEELFPLGAKAGWWAKTVQLDLEAKGVVVREKTKPLRLYKA